MKMLYALNKKTEEIDGLRESGHGPAGFEVGTAKVMYQAGTEFVRNRFSLSTYDAKEVYYRKDTGEPLAIHGLRYKPLQYPIMIDKVRDMIERSNLDATGLQEKISVSPNGGMCLVEYIFPAEKFTSPDGDTACLRIMALSSFNGVWSCILTVGLLLGACFNKEIFIKNPAAIYKARHTNKLDIDFGISVLGKVIDTVKDEVEFWHELHNTTSVPLEVFKMFADVSNYKDDIAEISWHSYKDNVTNKSMLYLLDKYQTHYAPLMGRNMWAVYNTITDWSTHAPSSAKNKIALMQRRTDQASEVMTKYLLAA
tara:strand:- start:1796 stop:2728 length:933 start_codon:yes stop_codon:yes gene_type:complete